MKKILFCLIFIVCINNNKVVAQSNLLCNAGWKKIAFTVTPAMQYWTNGKVESDLLKSERACTKDDYYVFNIDGTCQLLNGKNKCTEEESDLVSNGKWAFLKNDSTVLNISKTKTQGVLQKKIIKLSKQQFSFTYKVTKNEVVYTFIETFEAIE
jgi:hypothetical protein